MSGKLSTHVLDTYGGTPAAGVSWHLEFKSPTAPAWAEIAAGVTNADGRTDAPLLTGEALVTGSYRLSFAMGDYYKGKSVPLADPPFLDVVVLEVNLTAGESYHVPLLASPWSYSTYRGS
ncbi:hydroxyisourate hydrolase [Coraliomargarita parva]|uniref:hydroxyisourate hydrolase n=1 Tax=Coraliomargarita parva TaxID=3014050 RepID=UPI0022B3703A|nr:hydroxyisourate hydrolase [Coraliomargarita parva]